MNRDNKDLTKEEKEKITRKGIATGSALTIGGSLLALGGKAVEKRQPKSVTRNLKLSGISAAALGSILAGYSTYRHIKNKKDDSTEKKDV